MYLTRIYILQVSTSQKNNVISKKTTTIKPNTVDNNSLLSLVWNRFLHLTTPSPAIFSTEIQKAVDEGARISQAGSRAHVPPRAIGRPLSVNLCSSRDQRLFIHSRIVVRLLLSTRSTYCFLFLLFPFAFATIN